ncbi:tripartite tricarboxylate transporter substrate binding protein [Diaphorobacter sp. HDW4B]|uniref:Bug family tripartite tricarboxylate transporter substrate binding protein n=1 Tax=Diaphorobacter sp. HDW4B TaxID=2714925 RepID=UPI001F0FBB81|nr:tripartite tricarboxylate transporter substrate binding protein [Diaphorobacter sp. HDW4B]
MKMTWVGSISRSSWRPALGIALGLAGSVNLAHAAYPDRPITLEVGFAAGGPTDAMARVIATEMGAELKQSVVVDNKPGAGSNIAAVQVARAKPDGYTLLMVAVTSAINQTLYAKPGFNLSTDFEAVGLVGTIPSMLVVNPQLPVNSVQELVTYAKANPGKLTFGSSGNGTSIHIAGELFKSAANIDVTHVPYRGSAPAGAAVVAGQISCMFDNVPTVAPFVQAGRMRALAVTTKERIATAPAVPTMAESGFPDFDVSSWYGLIAPAKTPPEVIATLNNALQKVLSRPEFLERMKGMGVIVKQGTPDSFGKFMKSETERWAPIVKASGAKID